MGRNTADVLNITGTTSLPDPTLGSNSGTQGVWGNDLNTLLLAIDGEFALRYTGNPNGFVASNYLGRKIYDTTTGKVWVCSVIGTALTAVWGVNPYTTPIGTYNYLDYYPGDASSLLTGTGDVTAHVQNFQLYCQLQWYALTDTTLSDQLMRACVRAVYPVGKYVVTSPIIGVEGVDTIFQGILVRKGAAGNNVTTYDGDVTALALGNLWQPTFILSAARAHCSEMELYANSNGADNGSGFADGKCWVPSTIAIGVAGPGGFSAGQYVYLAQPSKGPYVAPKVTINTVNGSGVPTSITLTTPGSYGLPFKLQKQQYTTANNFTGAVANGGVGSVFDGSFNYKTQGGTGTGTGLTINVTAWAADFVGVAYNPGAQLVGDMMLGNICVQQSGFGYDGTFGSMFAHKSMGLNKVIRDIETEGGNIGWYINCADTRAGSAAIVNAQIGCLIQNGVSSVECQNMVFDTHVNQVLVIDGASNISMKGVAFLRGNGTYTQPGFQLGYNGGNASALNVALNLDFIVENTGTPTGVAAMQIAYTRGSKINLNCSNFKPDGTAAANFISGFCQFGSMVDESNVITGSIDGVLTSLFSGTIPNCAMMISDAWCPIFAATGTATITGSATNNDTISLTFTNTAFRGLPITKTITVTTAETTTAMATAVAAAINADTTLAAVGITATSSTNVVTYSCLGSQGNNLVVTKAVTGSATETVTLSNSGTLTGGASGGWAMNGGLYTMQGAGDPVNGITGLNKALPGSTYINNLNGNQFVSSGLASNPIWTPIRANPDNRIMNPCFEIDQASEGASLAVTSPAQPFGPDGWRVFFIGTATGVTAQQVSGGPAGYPTNLQITIGTGSATVNAGDQLFISQSMTGSSVSDLAFGTSAATTVSISFWAKSSVAGTFAWFLQNSASNRSYVKTFVVSAAQAGTWVRYTADGIPGDITGTWLATQAGIGLTFGISLECGSTHQGTAAAWTGSNIAGTSAQTNFPTTTGATFQLTGVKICPEPVATPLVRRPFDVEYNMAQRYYQKTFPIGTAPAQNAGVAGALTVKNPIATGDPAQWLQFFPKMIKAPAVTTYNPSANNANWRNITGSADVTVSVDPSTTIGANGVLIATSGTVTVLGSVLAIHVVLDSRL